MVLRIVALCTFGIAVGLVVIFLSGCTHEAQYELRPMFKSCRQAEAAGVPLPVGIADPGFNPKLDKNNDGKMC